MAIVYLARNKRNGKRYVGVTSRTLKYRSGRHMDLARKGGRQCPKFYDAVRKYGAAAFVWDVVYRCETMAEAWGLERDLIQQWRPEYNISAGGKGAMGFPAWNRRRVICLEDGKIYPTVTAAAKAYGSDAPEITRACRSKIGTAAGKHFQYCSRHMTEEDRLQLISEIDAYRVAIRKRGGKVKPPMIVNGRDSAGRSAAGPASISRRVVCLEDGMEFPSATACAYHYGVQRSALIELCLGQRNRQTVGGKRFAYLG